MAKRWQSTDSAAVVPFRVSREDNAGLIAKLPKAELHLHLEGSMEPETVVELAARHGIRLTREEVAAKYESKDFQGFIEAFKWVTSFLREPTDYALVMERLAETLLKQNVVYAEVTLAVGVMQWRKQDAEANFQAVREAGERARAKGLRLRWIFDCVRQFGPEAAKEVARLAARCQDAAVVAFGMGGDELSAPAEEFSRVYDFAASEGLHRVVHAGEIGGPEEVRGAIEILGAERVGHGIGVVRDHRIVGLVKESGVTLEVCPTSNLRTGALARQLGRSVAGVEEHPLPRLVRHGVRVTLGTDDPAMFGCTLNGEYALCTKLGLSNRETLQMAECGFQSAFLPAAEKAKLVRQFRTSANALGLVYSGS